MADVFLEYERIELNKLRDDKTKGEIKKGIKRMVSKAFDGISKFVAHSSSSSDKMKKKKDKKATPEEVIDRKESFIVIESVTNKDGKALPANFADKVLDLELKVDSGKFNIDTIDALTQLYSSAVEFYSSKNDQRYKYFTERL